MQIISGSGLSGVAYAAAVLIGLAVAVVIILLLLEQLV